MHVHTTGNLGHIEARFIIGIEVMLDNCLLVFLFSGSIYGILSETAKDCTGQKDTEDFRARNFSLMI